MHGLINTHGLMNADNFHPVLHAAIVAYGFVYLHPFEDGNGRIHRFLIHNILARNGFTPEGVMFPVSASMLKNKIDYDKSLEAFSEKLMPMVNYNLDNEGHLHVQNDTEHWYAYIDLTAQAEALFAFIEDTINTELKNELHFLSCYDKTKSAMQEIIDMPDRQIDLFIRFCMQNNGTVSEQKKEKYFAKLTDTEINELELVVAKNYQDKRL
jgi:Fic family protein